MSDKKNETTEQPFFVQFLEDQHLDEAQGGYLSGGTATKKYPSDYDEPTMKYPSDDDEGKVDV